MKTLFVALALARALDAASTCDALSRGATERNPLVAGGSCKASIVFEAGVTTGQTIALHSLNKTHPKIAKTLAIVSIAVEGWMIAHNSQVNR
jgi:hypothetical protein